MTAIADIHFPHDLRVDHLEQQCNEHGIRSISIHVEGGTWKVEAGSLFGLGDTLAGAVLQLFEQIDLHAIAQMLEWVEKRKADD